MEFRLPALFESLSEAEENQPLNTIDKGLRNQLIVDMMNSGMLQFSQSAVDEIVKEVDTKDKLDSIYKKVKELKSKLTTKKLPDGAKLIVDTLPSGAMPVLKTDNTTHNWDQFDAGFKYINDSIYEGLDIDKCVSSTPYIAEQAKTPAPSKEALSEKKAEIKERIATNSFNRLGMPATLSSARELITPTDFNAELSDMGIFTNSYEEQDQYVKFIGWTTNNYDALRSFIKVYRRCKHPDDKKILSNGIKEVVRDINASKITTWGTAFNSQGLLNRLTDCSVFLTAQEKEQFFKWSEPERAILERKITDHVFSRIESSDTVAELESANEIRDHILRINKQKEFEEHFTLMNELQDGDPIKSPAIRRTIKDLVHRLRVWGVIENNAEACDKQYNCCVNWDPANVEVLRKELNLISDGVLLFETLTKTQMGGLRKILTQFNDNPKVKVKISDIIGNRPLQGFEVLPKPAAFKYNEQINTLSMPGAVNMDNNYVSYSSIGPLNTADSTVTIKSPTIKLESPNIEVNGKQVDFSKLIVHDDDYAVVKESVVSKETIVSSEDLSNWKDICAEIDLSDNQIHTHPDMFDTDPLFDWDVFNAQPLTMPNVKKEDGQFVKEAKKAGVRVAATQLNNVTKGIVAAALPGDKSALLQQFLSSELGTSFISMVNGMALTYAMKDNERAQMLAKEFRVSSLTTAGNFAVEDMLDLVAGVVKSSLPSESHSPLSVKEIDWEEEIELDYSDFIEEKTLKV